MKKKLLLAICLMASVSGYAQWWSGHAENVVFDEDARTMTITGLIAGHLGDILVTDYGTEHINLRIANTYTWENLDVEGDNYLWEPIFDPAPVETLVITGELNGDDIKVISDMAKKWINRPIHNFDDLDNETPPDNINFFLIRGGLKHLDISDAQIVSGGTYFKVSGGKYYYYDWITNSEKSIDTESIGINAWIFDGTELTTNRSLSATDNEIGEVMFAGCNIIESIELPSTITKIGKKAFAWFENFEEITIPASVNKIESFAFWQCFDMNDPDWVPGVVPAATIKFEGSESLIELEENALKTYDSPIAFFVVDTPLSQLGDYAVDKGDGEELILKDNIDKGALKATATPPNKYWTFSCGVDIVLPENIKAYTCRIVDGETDIVELTNAQLDADEDGKRVIPANNGVLLACPDNAESNAYDMVVQYNEGITAIATEDAKTWGDQNALVPVIRKAHYNPGDYYMLYHGKWVVLASDAEQVPAGKALLKK